MVPFLVVVGDGLAIIQERLALQLAGAPESHCCSALRPAAGPEVRLSAALISRIEDFLFPPSWATAYSNGSIRDSIAFMDLIAEQFDFNDHALRRLTETIKDALDPHGVLLPGKQGIWPSRFRTVSR
jgi:hypothetical protein